MRRDGSVAVPYWPASGVAQAPWPAWPCWLWSWSWPVSTAWRRRAVAFAGRHRSGQHLCRRPARVVSGGRVRVFAPVSRPWQVIPIFIVPGLLVCIVLAMPFLAKHPLGHVFNVVFTLALLAAVAGMTYYSLAKDRADPQHQKAIAAEQRQAQRVRRAYPARGHPAHRRPDALAQRSEDARPAALCPAVFDVATTMRSAAAIRWRRSRRRSPRRRISPAMPAGSGSPACWTRSRSTARSISATRSSAAARWRAS